VQGDAWERLAAEPIDWRFRGFPMSDPPTRVDDVPTRGWTLSGGDLPLPVLVLRREALAHNLDTMMRYCRSHDVSLAPHAKTTMAPQLLRAQLDAGAWGVTAATPAQVRTIRAFGFSRILLANQLVEPRAIRQVAHELEADESFEFLCLADSLAGVDAMSEELEAAGSHRPLRVLVELGVPGGRTGCRTRGEAVRVADAVRNAPALELAGVEGYEGVVRRNDLQETLASVDAFLDEVLALVRMLNERGTFGEEGEVVVSAGGSAFFDRVVERIREPLGSPLDERVRVVLRSGCFLTHDSGHYERLSPFGGVRGVGQDRFQPALEVWGSVLSRPEPELAVVGLGRRDAAFDVDLPIPLHARSHGDVRDVRETMVVVDVNDQHAFLRVPAGDRIGVGDVLVCGISHPCTTLDKWSLIPVIDEDGIVVDAVRTFF
jgi:D-serine deaminase-like pyridoxal phosphate-dependent protein